MVKTLAPSIIILQPQEVLEITVKARKTPTRLCQYCHKGTHCPIMLWDPLQVHRTLINPGPNSEGGSSTYKSRTKLLVPIAPYYPLLLFTFPDFLSHHSVCILEIPVIHRTAAYPVIDVNANVYIIVCTKIPEKCSYP